MLVTPAYAQAATGGAPTDMLLSLAPFVLIFAIMYFLIIRPQRQRQKAHQEMIKNVRRGDTIVTSGGFIGKVTKVIDDNEVEVQIADNVRTRIVRSAIGEGRAMGEPVNDNG